MEETVKQVMAWIIPETVGEAYPICERTVKLGYNPLKNDGILNSCFADGEQAAFHWKDGELYLTSLSDNGQTVVNHVALGKGESGILYHQDHLDLAGQAYQVLRRDRKRFAEVIFRDVSGSVIAVHPCCVGACVVFPKGPEKAGDSKYHYQFVQWELAEGSPVDDKGCCTGYAVYEASYEKIPNAFTVTFQAEGGFMSSEGMELTLQCNAEEKIAVPDGKDLRPIDGLCFEKWELVEGDPLCNGCCCSDMVFKACYQSAESTGTVKMQVFFYDQDKKFYPVMPFAPFLFGCSASCSIRTEGVPEVCASLDGKTQRLICQIPGYIKLNGFELPGGEQQLYNGDRLEFAGKVYTLSSPNQPRYACLVNPDGQEIRLEEGETHLGQWHQKKFWMHSPFVGRNHAVIRGESGQYFVIDEKSTNGTYLRGEKIKSGEPILLKSGDRINFADVCCIFTIR